MTLQELDIQTRTAQAEDRRKRDAQLKQKRTAQHIAIGLENFSNILRAAEHVFTDIDLSMLPGEYLDETPAAPDITKVEIKYIGWCTWRVRARKLGYDAYVKDWYNDQHFTPFTTRTTEGYCNFACQCSYCQVLRQQREVHA